jgi:hypothetical protein
MWRVRPWNKRPGRHQTTALLSMLASMETQMIPLIPFSDLSPDLDRIMAIWNGRRT